MRRCRARCGPVHQGVARSTNRINEGIAPYSRFVRAEGENLKVMDQELREILDALGSLRHRLERVAA